MAVISFSRAEGNARARCGFALAALYLFFFILLVHGTSRLPSGLAAVG